MLKANSNAILLYVAVVARSLMEASLLLSVGKADATSSVRFMAAYLLRASRVRASGRPLASAAPRRDAGRVGVRLR